MGTEQKARLPYVLGGGVKIIVEIRNKTVAVIIVVRYGENTLLCVLKVYNKVNCYLKKPLNLRARYAPDKEPVLSAKMQRPSAWAGLKLRNSMYHETARGN